jgi:hypothetical protein
MSVGNRWDLSASPRGRDKVRRREARLGWGVDAASRAKSLFEQGATTEEVVRGLRSDGLSLIESISALAQAAGMSGSDASAAVLDSPTWADERSLVTTNKWIDPPHPPDAETLERLRAACHEEPCSTFNAYRRAPLVGQQPAGPPSKSKPSGRAVTK